MQSPGDSTTPWSSTCVRSLPKTARRPGGTFSVPPLGGRRPQGHDPRSARNWRIQRPGEHRGTAPDAVARLEIVKKFLGYLKKQGVIEVSLAQHLRLRKGRTSTARSNQTTVERTVVRLTKQGYQELTTKLAEYREERRQIADDIHRAAADKDVRENAPLEAAREAQGMLQSKINEIEATLRAASVIDESIDTAGARIGLGSTIVLEDKGTGRTTTFQIVAPNEASPLQAKISSASPVGSAVLGRAPGDQIRVKTPRGLQTYLIVRTM